MITDAEIINGTVGLDSNSDRADAKELALLMLVRRYPLYKEQTYNWPDLAGRIHTARLAGTAEDVVRSKALSAVLIRLAQFPGIVVESEGTDKRRTFFSSRANWEELAQDVLDILYEAPAYGAVRLATIQRTLDDLRSGPSRYRLLDEKSGLQT